MQQLKRPFLNGFIAGLGFALVLGLLLAIGYLHSRLTKLERYVASLGPPPAAVAGTTPASLAAGGRPAVRQVPLQKFFQIGEAPSRGPAGAAVTVTEYADFHCSFCKKAASTIHQLLQKYPGKVRHVFRHFVLTPTPGTGSFLTHEASVCAQEQGKFWEFHDKVFAADPAPQPADLDRIAAEIGLDTSRFQECLKSGKHRSFLQEETKAGGQKGVQGTPTFYVNEKQVAGAYPLDYFTQLVESILNPGKAAPPGEPAAQKPSEPSTPPPAKKVEFTDLKGRPSVGPENASVTLVEFSDFHCPFCQKVSPTVEQLMKNYEGKIRRVWRHYPLAMHTGAGRTHEASECAHDQGKFWPYHDKLFATIGQPRDDESLIQIAEEADLNKKKFKKCLESGKYRDLVQKEISAGSAAGVSGTPAVFVNGRLVAGAYPYEYFDNLVKDELNKKS